MVIQVLYRKLTVFTKKLMNESTTLEEVCKSPVIEEISSLLKPKTDFLASSKTAQLWLQYMDMINILRKYIRAERTGNWELHLQAVSEMLPYMTASGHNNYTKCIWIYLQQMSSLKSDYAALFNKFSM